MGPHQLRREIGSINDMFLGGGQHDCHELLTLLLDTLSEDLNRVKGKKVFREVSSPFTNHPSCVNFRCPPLAEV